MAASRPKRPSGKLATLVLALLAVGFASSVYLTNLYIEATEALKGGTKLDSFCNLSQGVNCETVAASEYSAFLGIPISVWGLEYFGLAIAIVLASHYRLLSLKRWDSLLFALSCTGVPVTIVLGYISVTIIQSVCIMCVTVYVVNTAMVLLLAGLNRSRLKEFVREGPMELLALATHANHRVVTVFAVILGLSQFLWVPRLFARPTHGEDAASTLAAVSNAKTGTWKELPASRNTLGPVNAPIRIEEFTDFQCPFCGRAHDVLLEVVTRYPGKIHLIHRDFPLDHHCNPAIPEPFHPDACGAAYFARCAADQDLFWPYEALLFHNQRKLKKAAMLSFAQTVGLNTTALQTCVESKVTHQAVLADIDEGIKRGVAGTPAFFVNGEAIVGARPIEFWEEKIQTLLGLAPPASASSATLSTSAAPPSSALPAMSAAPSASNPHPSPAASASVTPSP